MVAVTTVAPKHNHAVVPHEKHLRNHILSNKALVTVAVVLLADVPVQLPDECGEDYRASLVGFDLVLRQQLGVS